MTDTSHITSIAISRAEALLRSAGCEYAIRTSNGTTLGTLPIVPPKPEKPARKRRPRQSWSHTGYRTAMDAMETGHVLTWTFETKEEAEGLRSCVSAHAVKLWGKQAAITSTSNAGPDFQVSVLRVL